MKVRPTKQDGGLILDHGVITTGGWSDPGRWAEQTFITMFGKVSLKFWN